MRRIPGVAEALLKITPEELDFKPGPKRWSVREIVHHLADSEMTAAVRLRLLVARIDRRFRDTIRMSLRGGCTTIDRTRPRSSCSGSRAHRPRRFSIG